MFSIVPQVFITSLWSLYF